MKTQKWLTKAICIVLGVAMIMMPACVSSERGLGKFSERMAGERTKSSEETLSPPVLEITQKPTMNNPQMNVKVLADAIKRDSIIQRYERLERTEQTTSGEGLLILGGVTMGLGFFDWLINTIQATQTTDSSGAALSAAEQKKNEDTYGPKATQGLGILLLGLVPLIIGASTDRQVVTVDKPVGSYETNITRDNNLGRKVPMANLVVSATVKNGEKTSSTSIVTDPNGIASLKIDNILTQSFGDATVPLPENVRVVVEPRGGSGETLYYDLEQAIGIMSLGKVNWSKGSEGLAPYPESKLEISGKAKANETVVFKINVSNKKGKGDCYRMQAIIKSDDPFFNNQRILVGRLKAGDEITVERSYEIPRLWRDRAIPLTIVFEELYGNIPETIKATLSIEGLPRPALSYSYQIFDDGSGNSTGNGDGILQKGEAVEIEVTVNNTGSGPATDVNAYLGFNEASIEGIRIMTSNLSLGDLMPNESKKGRFNVQIKRTAQVNEVKFNIKIDEKGLQEETQYVVSLKVGASTESKAITMNPKPAYVTGAEIAVRAGASPDSIARFKLKKDSALNIIGQMGDWYKVDLGNERYGWASINDLSFAPPNQIATNTPAAAPTVIQVVQQQPPLIALASPSRLVMETTDDSIKISGTAADDSSVEKVEILVNNQLVKSLNTRGISIVGKKETAGEKVPNYQFEYVLPLQPGLNEIKVIASDDEGQSKGQIIKVTRVEEKGEVYVLVIGITKYEDVGINSLPFAEVDAQSIYDFYAKSPKSLAKPENVTLLIGNQATGKGIRMAIGSLAKKAKAPDTVICYYAGHGDVGKHPTKNAEYYMIPQDAAKDDLFSSAIELSDLQRLWSGVISKRKVFITDSCNSGGFTELRGVGQDGFEQGLGEGTVVMTASGKGQKALEVPELKHGLFTYYLLKGLEGAADTGGNGKISISGLKKYVEENVRNKAKELGGKQDPVTKIETTGEIYLTR